MGVGQGPGRHHLNVHTAFAAYESVRHRLPHAKRTAACQPAENLDSISHCFDAFLLDAFGVLNIGETAIPGAPERVAGLQRQGKRVIVVSNAASLPRSALSAKYARLGFDFAPEDIITSRIATLRGLQNEPVILWGLMLSQEIDHDDLHHINKVYLDDDAATYQAADGFLLLGSGAWTEERQVLLENAIQDRPRPVLVGNPDIVAPRELGFSVEPGHYAHRISDKLDTKLAFFGKPFPSIFDLARARLNGIDPDRILMVGDSLHTDILGGLAAGIKTALIAEYGFFAGADVNSMIRISGIQPDFILKRP